MKLLADKAFEGELVMVVHDKIGEVIDAPTVFTNGLHQSAVLRAGVKNFFVKAMRLIENRPAHRQIVAGKKEIFTMAVIDRRLPVIDDELMNTA
ncbi:MAG: hypothetical protein BWY83_03414 [bacterium ADurb.Bin478]|nr:MAG: hypothetical protein BWY83_03414 [bacterium ADurb.Bin478]